MFEVCLVFNVFDRSARTSSWISWPIAFLLQGDVGSSSDVPIRYFA